MVGTAEAQEAARRLRLRTRTDALTGLPNRHFVNEELSVRINDVGAGIPLVVAVFDADRLQLVNETFSHDVGDRALQELGRLLETALAAPSFVARLGGDKFLAVLPGLDLSAAAEVLESIRAAVEGHAWERIVGDLRLTVSVGAAMAYATDTPTALLARSDRNLYAAKKAGRNRVATGTR
jgi:diguanylate cyclase (GGDEF)-like protein